MAGGEGRNGSVMNVTGGLSQGSLYYDSSSHIGGSGGGAYCSAGGNGHKGSPGDDGNYPGGGGAGGNGTYASGAGADGLVIIEEFA